MAASLRNADPNKPLDMAKFKTNVLSGVPAMLNYRRALTGWGRMGKAIQFAKDLDEVSVEQALKTAGARKIDEILSVDWMKASPEELSKYIDDFGTLEGWRILFDRLRNNKEGDLKAVHKELMDVQKAFQSPATLKRFKEGGSMYEKIQSMAVDEQYFNYLSSTPTLFRVIVGNALMNKLHSYQGRLGSAYLKRRAKAYGMKPEDFEKTEKFWKRMYRYQTIYKQLAFAEAGRTFRTGAPADLMASQFEKMGKTAFSPEALGWKEGTDLNNALRAATDNYGKYVNLFGTTMQAIDSRSRQRTAHAMVMAKALEDWEGLSDEAQALTPFIKYYKKVVDQVFKDSEGVPVHERTITLPEELGGGEVVVPVGKFLKEEDVKREALKLAAEKNLMGQDLVDFVEKYVEVGWNPSVSKFTEYVQRNLREMTFTEEWRDLETRMTQHGKEIPDVNWAEGMAYAWEKLFNSHMPPMPLVKGATQPFMRSARNIARETGATTSLLGHIPGFRLNQEQAGWLQLTPGMANLYKKTMGDLASGDPRRMAVAKGKQLMGAGAWALAFASGGGLYVGMRSTDLGRERGFQRGERTDDYTFRIPDPWDEHKTHTFDLSPAVPLIDVFNMAADFRHVIESQEVGGDLQDKAMVLAHGAKIAIANNFLNKSYNKALRDIAIGIFETIPEDLEKLEQRQGKTLSMESKNKWLKIALGSLFTSSAENMAVRLSDPLVRENDELVHSLARRMNGLSRLVPPQLDRFGGLVPTDDKDETGAFKTPISAWNTFVPFKYRSGKGSIDAWIKEKPNGRPYIDVSKVDFKDEDQVNAAAFAILLETNVAGEFPRSEENLAKVDLKKLRKSYDKNDRLGWERGEVQNAHWRYQRLAGTLKANDWSSDEAKYYINPATGKKVDIFTGFGKRFKGLNVREALVKAFQDKEVQAFYSFRDPKMDDEGAYPVGDPRKIVVTNILAAYRSAAFTKLAQEYPVIGENIQYWMAQNKESRRLRGAGKLEPFIDPEGVSPIQQLIDSGDMPKDPLPALLQQKHPTLRLLKKQ